MTIKEISTRLNLPIKTLQTREDGRVEWLCSHGIGHTIYNPNDKGTYAFVHGCDGCCNNIEVIA